MRRRILLFAAAGVLVLAACASDDRPTLRPAETAIGGLVGQPVGDPSVDAVLALLEGPGPSEFSAAYTVTQKLGANSTAAQVVRQDEVTSVTVGDVRFLDADEDLTCSVAGGTCEDGILDARISDYSVSSSFWSTSPARALRVAFSRRSGSPQPASLDIGGLTASCVDVPVGPGSERYCATPAGPVAFWDTAATQVSLTGYQDTPDQTAFIVPGAPPSAGTTTG